MDSKKYIGMDVHKESISIAVMNSAGRLVMESVIETKASTILQFVYGLNGGGHLRGLVVRCAKGPRHGSAGV
jgi:hypothetical protein